MNAPFTAPSREDEINLLDYWRVLVRRRVLILCIVAVVTFATTIFVLLYPNIYRSETTLLPLGESQGGPQAILGELDGLLPLALGDKQSPAERILAVLKSRTLAENVIKRLDLLPHLFPNDWNVEKQAWDTDDPPTIQDGVRALEQRVPITVDMKTDVITIAAEHTDPEMTAQIANQYVHILQRLLYENAFSLAKKNRLFIESQLRKNKKDLAAAEEALQRFELKYSIVAPEAQADAAVDAMAALKGQIMAKEVQLRVLQRLVTGASEEVTLQQEELEGLRSQLAQLQHGTLAQRATAQPDTHIFPALDEAPEIKLRYVRLKREVLIQNELFELLTQQLEQAKIEEAKDETAFQVLDRAISPEKKFKPKRALSVILATVVGVFLGGLMAFFHEHLDSTIHSREQIEQQIGVPLLATIPPTESSRSRRGWRQAPDAAAGLMLSQPPGAPDVEALRYLHTRLKHYQGERGAQTMLFTSANPHEAIALILVNLARVAASTGEKILLVDTNLRQPALHHLLACPIAPGLADVLGDSQEWHKGVQTTQVDNLYFIPAGTVRPTSFATLESLVFDALLTHGKETYDLILCTAPPVLSFSDAAVLSRKVDATCLVLTSGVSLLDAVVEAKTALEVVQARIIGAVLTM